MARAQQVVGLLLPQADRAANMGADLGVAEYAADLPALAGGRDRDGVGIHSDNDDRCLGLLDLELGAMKFLEVRGLAVDQLTDLDILRPDRCEGDVLNDANTRCPDSLLDSLGTLLLGGPWTQIGCSDS